MWFHPDVEPEDNYRPPINENHPVGCLCPTCHCYYCDDEDEDVDGQDD